MLLKRIGFYIGNIVRLFKSGYSEGRTYIDERDIFIEDCRKLHNDRIFKLINRRSK